jgi:hypothetical protein
MRLDRDLQDRGVVAARERGEGLAAALTTALLSSQVADLLRGGQVGVIAAAMAFAAASLTASARHAWRRASRGRHVSNRGVRRREVGLRVVWSQAVGGVVGLGASSEEPVAEVADFGLEASNLLLERIFALAGALVHGLIIVRLLAQRDGFETVRAGLAASLTGGRRRGGFTG